MKETIKKLIEKALEKLKKDEKLDFDLPEINVDYPKNETFGDYTTNVAMILSKTLKKDPIEIANNIKDQISKIKSKEFEKIEIVKPGYINFHLSKEYLQNKIAEINKLEEKYGDSQKGKGVKVNNEFISANPTGPLTIGNGRGGFLGDAVSHVLKKCGYAVTNEYYVNDGGEQIIKLGHSVLKDSEAVYAGEYIDELNKKLENSEDVKKMGEKSAEIILNDIVKKTVKEKMKIAGMNYVHEKDLCDDGYIKKAIKILKDKKLTLEKEGALWLKTTEFRDDKDRVLIKSDGQKTYLASDCGYILNKIERGFDKLIEIWGADHYGYIARFKAAAEALGFRGDLRFIIVQLVRLVKDGKEARMSKRTGNVVYIDELIEKVGLDVTRFFFLLYSPDTHMNFDLGLAEEKSEKNPVYYVQYAHARICSILRKSKITNDKLQINSKLELLTHNKELNLIRELNKFPELIGEIAETYEVHKLPYYAIKLADKFHSFYNDLIVLDPQNEEVTAARLKLVNAVRIVLAEVLKLMGVKTPDHM